MTTKNHAPDTDPRRDRFERVILPRVRKAAKAIELIGNGASRDYQTRPEEVTELLTDVRAALHAVEARYAKHLGTSVAPVATVTPEPASATDAETFAADSLEAWRAECAGISYHRSLMLATYAPEALVGTLITHLVDRLCKMAEGHDG